MHQYITRVEVLKGINVLRPGPEPEPEPEPEQPQPRGRLLTPPITSRFAGDSAASWTFDNDGPSFQAMSESIAQQLEAAYKQRKSAITLQTPHGEYTYDLQRLTQVNTATGRIRNIRRAEMPSPAPSPRPAASEEYLPAGDTFPAPRTWTHQQRTQNCVLEKARSLNHSVCTHSEQRGCIPMYLRGMLVCRCCLVRLSSKLCKSVWQRLWHTRPYTSSNECKTWRFGTITA